jgi:hypothetical protein
MHATAFGAVSQELKPFLRTAKIDPITGIDDRRLGRYVFKPPPTRAPHKIQWRPKRLPRRATPLGIFMRTF